jgi:hypothetical protein
MNIAEFQKDLEEIDTMQTELKRRAMVYQYEEKMYLADFFEIPANNRPKMELMSYKAYCDIEDAFSKLKINAEKEFNNQKNPDTSILLGQIWSSYSNNHVSEWQDIRKIIIKAIDL